MGFSTSTSFAVVFFGVFVAVGGMYTAATNTYGQVKEANEESRDRFETLQGTAVDVTAAEVVATGPCTVQVNVTNEGETALSVNDTDVLVDGEYQSGWTDDATVAGERTDVWLPGERLSLNATGVSAPARVKVVTETGVAAFASVEGGSRC